MGGGHRNKQKSGQHHRRHSSGGINLGVASKDTSLPSNEADDSTADLVLESTALHRLTWLDLLLLVLVLMVCILLSLMCGVVAYISLSIHYCQEPSQQRAKSYGLPHRITRTDASIAASNQMYRHRGSSILHVMHAQPLSREQSALMVVEESPPLRHDTTTTTRPSAASREGTGKQADVPPRIEPPRMDFEEWTRYHPKLCSDGKTVGFDDWKTLKAAIQDANTFSAERFVRWNEYFALAESSFTGTFDDASLYYEQGILFRICPRTTLKARKGPIFINAENVRIECDGCTVDVGGTHLSFGPHARNVVVRGIDFRRAATSSLVFHHDGAEASFEDCRWLDNTAIHNKLGSVADVNSTSIVHFHRCLVGKRSNSPPGFVSALSIRSA